MRQAWRAELQKRARTRTIEWPAHNRANNSRAVDQHVGWEANHTVARGGLALGIARDLECCGVLG